MTASCDREGAEGLPPPLIFVYLTIPQRKKEWKDLPDGYVAFHLNSYYQGVLMVRRPGTTEVITLPPRVWKAMRIHNYDSYRIAGDRMVVSLDGEEYYVPSVGAAKKQKPPPPVCNDILEDIDEDEDDLYGG